MLYFALITRYCTCQEELHAGFLQVSLSSLQFGLRHLTWSFDPESSETSFYNISETKLQVSTCITLSNHFLHNYKLLEIRLLQFNLFSLEQYPRARCTGISGLMRGMATLTR